MRDITINTKKGENIAFFVFIAPIDSRNSTLRRLLYCWGRGKIFLSMKKEGR